MNLSMFADYRIVVNDELCTKPMMEQYRFPRSKKKRIRAKWRKRKGNWRPTGELDHYAYVDDEKRVVFLSTRAEEELRRRFLAPDLPSVVYPPQLLIDPEVASGWDVVSPFRNPAGFLYLPPT